MSAGAQSVHSVFCICSVLSSLSVYHVKASGKCTGLLMSDLSLQDIHGPLLSSSVRKGMSAAQLALPVRQAAFMEVADCFAAMLPDPQVGAALLPRCSFRSDARSRLCATSVLVIMSRPT